VALNNINLFYNEDWKFASSGSLSKYKRGPEGPFYYIFDII